MAVAYAAEVYIVMSSGGDLHFGHFASIVYFDIPAKAGKHVLTSLVEYESALSKVWRVGAWRVGAHKRSHALTLSRSNSLTLQGLHAPPLHRSTVVGKLLWQTGRYPSLHCYAGHTFRTINLTY